MTHQNETLSQFQQHFGALLMWARTQTPGWLSSKLDPADLVQQTLLEAVKTRQSLDGKPEHEILAFLRRALTNNLIDAARKFGRNREDVSPDQFSQSSRRMGDWLAAPDTSPSERFARNERFSRLAEGLARLPDSQRIAVEMRYLQGAKVAEIAKALQRTEGAIAALLHRAVTTLKAELNDLDL